MKCDNCSIALLHIHISLILHVSNVWTLGLNVPLGSFTSELFIMGVKSKHTVNVVRPQFS